MNISYKTIRRVRINAPMSEREQVIDWVYKNGYRTVRIGPKVTKFPKVDMNRLLVIAEKEV